MEEMNSEIRSSQLMVEAGLVHIGDEVVINGLGVVGVFHQAVGKS